jgi:hypothetical protein
MNMMFLKVIENNNSSNTMDVPIANMINDKL